MTAVRSYRATLETARDKLAQAVEDGHIPGYKLDAALRSLVEMARELELIDAPDATSLAEAAATPDEPWNPYT